MSKKVCSLLCIVLFVASMGPLCASEMPVSIQIKPASETIRSIRYQSGALPGQAWMGAPLEAAPLVLEGFDSDTDFLFVQQAETDGMWSELYVYQYDKYTKQWSVDVPTAMPSPRVSIGAFGGLLFTSEDASHLYTNSYGGGAEISVNISKFHYLASAQVHTAKSNNIWADTYTILSLTGGLGYTIFEYKKSEIAAMCRYGLITHWNGSTWYFNQRGEIGLRLSYEVSDQICPFFESGVLVMFANSSNTILFNGSIGIQYTI